MNKYQDEAKESQSLYDFNWKLLIFNPNIPKDHVKVFLEQ